MLSHLFFPETKYKKVSILLHWHLLLILLLWPQHQKYGQTPNYLYVQLLEFTALLGDWQLAKYHTVNIFFLLLNLSSNSNAEHMKIILIVSRKTGRSGNFLLLLFISNVFGVAHCDWSQISNLYRLIKEELIHWRWKTSNISAKFDICSSHYYWTQCYFHCKPHWNQ